MPQAVIHNFGTRNETDFPVTLSIGPAYSQTMTASLGVGETDTLSFPSWEADPIGVLPTVCYTALETDIMRANDTTRSQVEVLLVSDVGTEAVLEPVGLVHLNEGILSHKVSPRARIANFGQITETNFEVRFRIDSVLVHPGPETIYLGTAYEQTVTVASLGAGERLEVQFPDVALGFGYYAVTCSTRLAVDANPVNDRDQKTYNVQAFLSSGPGDFEAIIYTRAGERVRSISRRLRQDDAMLAEWDGTNDRGRPCAPGIYICRLEFKPDDGPVQHQFFNLLVTTDFTGMVLTWR